MSEPFSVSLQYDPMPTPRPRFRAFTVRGKVITNTYHPKEYTEYKKALAALLSEAFVTASGDPLPVYDEALFVKIHIEAAKPKTTKLPAPRPDVDNYAKGVLDAAADAGLLTDDKHVVVLHVSKAWGTEGSIRLTMEPLA